MAVLTESPQVRTASTQALRRPLVNSPSRQIWVLHRRVRKLESPAEWLHRNLWPEIQNPVRSEGSRDSDRPFLRATGPGTEAGWTSLRLPRRDAMGHPTQR